MKIVLMDPTDRLRNDDGFTIFMNKCLFLNYEFLKVFTEKERESATQFKLKLEESEREIIELKHQIKKLEKVRYNLYDKKLSFLQELYDTQIEDIIDKIFLNLYYYRYIRFTIAF